MLKSTYLKRKKKQSRTVSYADIEAEDLKDFFESAGRSAYNFGKKVASTSI